MENRRRTLPRLYLAGPANEASAFAAGRLQAAGFDVVNQGETPEPADAPEWGDWARRTLADLLTADGVALSAAAGRSRGTALACHLAHELAVPVRTVPAWLTKAGQDAYMQRLIGKP